ncbi:MAG: AAA family ATPase [Spirochaeta sp.]
MEIQEIHTRLNAAVKAISYSFVGSPLVIQHTMLGLLAGLHILVEDVPGVGKTTLCRTIARVAGLDFGRIQLSPDVLPGDIVGMNIYDANAHEFVFRAGAIEHQFVLADELNRASERTQSAMLEAMQEEQVTVDGETRPLPQPFLLMATQNPSHFAGTFRLPESQLDRFGIALSIGYPNEDQELAILELVAANRRPEDAEVVFSADEIISLRHICAAVHMSEAVRRYVTAITAATRKSRQLDLGVSPRAAGHLLRAARAAALYAGRDYVIPEDVREIAPAVLAHRLTLSAEARIDAGSTRQVLLDILENIPMPSGT